jgi:hypothetical protein
MESSWPVGPAEDPGMDEEVVGPVLRIRPHS